MICGDRPACSSAALTAGVLLADDDSIWVAGSREEARRLAIRTTVVSDAKSALRALRTERPGLAIVEPNLPGTNWVRFLRRLRVQCPALPIIAATSFQSDAMAEESRRLGIRYLIKKRIVPAALWRSLDGELLALASPPSSPSLSWITWNHLNATLLACEGRMSQAAARLGISRRGLYYKLRTIPS